MIAIVGGLGAAVAFATATLSSSRATKLIGPRSLVSGVMLVGLAITLPAAAAKGIPAQLDRGAWGWLAVSGVGNVAGLLSAYAALRTGKVGVVAPIVSTEGAIAAVIAVVAGESIAPGAGVTLAVIAGGILLAAISREGATSARLGTRPLLYSILAAVCFGVSLYATGRIGATLPVAWAVLPARVVGVVAVALPLAFSSGLRITRAALPYVLLSGVCEIAGFGLFTVGARHGLAVSAVLASQFAALAAVAAYLLFRERLARVQLAGVAAIVLGVAVLSGLQA
jgi:drug/metabolite transporter (DMT)-like permease